MRPFYYLWLLIPAIALLAGAMRNNSGGEDFDARGENRAAAPSTKFLPSAVAVRPRAATTLTALNAGWGHFKGRFTLAGAPQPAAEEITKDEAYCGKFKLVDESLVVAADGGLANVVVMINVKRGDALPAVHESYQAREKERVALDNFECRFAPRVVLLRSAQTLEIKNSDPQTIGHNAKADTEPPFNDIVPPGTSIVKQLKAQRQPSTVSCSIHPWMIGKIIVRDSPYMAVTNRRGEFTIEHLPAGTWEFQCWHERLEYLTKVNIDGQAAEWSRGLIKVDIAGEKTTDLGEVKLKYADYPR